jgi:sugar lactone lactonase YvrE
MPTSSPALRVLPVPGLGAEDVAVDDDGRVYTGTGDGSVYRLSPDGQRVDQVGRTGGRPMGIEVLPDGRLLVCDAVTGLLALDPASGRVETWATSAAGRRLTCLNNATVHSSGDVYFSDSSAIYGIERWEADIAENTASGRLLVRRADGGTERLLDGMRFANGVALTADESAVLVAECAGRRIVRRWLTGDRAGTSDDFVADLPGYPDNLSRGTDGLVWAAIASPTDPVLERLMTGPRALRRAAWRLPEKVRPKPGRTVRVMAFTDAGELRHDLSLDATGFHMATGVREHHGTVWLGSLKEAAVACFTLP